MSKTSFEDEIERMFDAQKISSEPENEYDNFADIITGVDGAEEPDPSQLITSLRLTNVLGGQVLVAGSNGNTIRFVDPYELAKYSIEDIDKLIMMLTLWIDDISTRDKLEEIYKYWKELQRKA